MKNKIYTPDWVVSSDYSEHGVSSKWYTEFLKKTTKEICEEIKNQKQ